MIELSTKPLKLFFDNEGNELFLDGKKLKADKRMLEELKPVLCDEKFVNEKNEKRVQYYMYRNISVLGKARYDITIIPALDLGKEFNKTLGHYHALSSSGHSFCEVYEVLEGEAHYLLQKKVGAKITDVLLVKAKKGEKVFVPPDYGHVTINPSKKTLVMANWTNEAPSDYSEFIEKKGGAYYEFIDGRVEKNVNYGKVPEIKIVEAKKLRHAFDGKENIFAQATGDEKKLEGIV